MGSLRGWATATLSATPSTTPRSYKIAKSGKKVTTTSKAGKKISVKAGTYKVKTTVKYKVGKKKKTYTKTSTVKVKKTAPVTMSYTEFKKISNGMTYAEVKSIVGGGGTRTWYYESSYDDYVCDDDYENCWYETVTTVYADYEWKNGSSYGRGLVSFEDGVVTYKSWIS